VSFGVTLLGSKMFETRASQRSPAFCRIRGKVPLRLLDSEPQSSLRPLIGRTASQPASLMFLITWDALENDAGGNGRLDQEILTL
jgi:hypothetical protein